ncbi:MAG: hypothetical protein V4793_09850 [Paraburkholderia tropica]|uniref:Uncharacterized protein n=1 Tax=Paraburkholderia tropica TaxID=92647 RepID=A0ABX5MZZ8_9BURK|nr:hypothetical protein [Paraburkholderia tropica]MDE1139631.1 hypothetical protein [Paraburkholderia tropica]PXX20019.1 hypothetical protein C7400_102444 [Paraburkholderia tropica]PZW88960.1 hypothetical protein C7399_102444 [Paraburkholderia tropica]
MRFILTGSLLCALASTALAGEHYIEIWNPPEARTPGAHPATTDKKGHGHHGAKHKLANNDRLGTRKVAEPALRASAPTVPVLPGSTPMLTKPEPGTLPAIPPQIGPDGNVLQVGYAVSARRAQSPLMALSTVQVARPSMQAATPSAAQSSAASRAPQ